MRFELLILKVRPWYNQVPINTFQQFGASNEVRTRDLDLGKVALYQLSYTRIPINRFLT